ncbi:MAG: hypothetical protein U0354_12925 [Candidatus Sericytochromatia bacterium]
MKVRIYKFLSALALSFVLYTNPVNASGKIPESSVIMVDGESAIVDSTSTAEKNAVAEALRTAVEQATGVYLMSETKVQNFQTLSDEIYTKATGFVSEYEVISKNIGKDTVKVKVKATVSVEPLVESLKKLGLLRKWTVAVLMADNSQENKNYSEAALTAINENVLNSGFRVVDQEVISSLEKPDILKQINSGNYLAASQILKDNGVDVLVIAKAHSEEVAGNNVDAYGVNVYLSSAKGRLDTKVVRADTAELLATKTFEGAGVGAGKDVRAEALKNSGNIAGAYLVSQIMKLPASTTAYIQLSIKGVSFAKAKEMINALKEVKGVRKVTSRGFRNKEALFEIETDGDVNLLADNISENKTLSKLHKLDINSVSAGKIEAEVVK